MPKPTPSHPNPAEGSKAGRPNPQRRTTNTAASSENANTTHNGSASTARPSDALQNTQSTSNVVPTTGEGGGAGGKKKKRRKRRNRRQSFLAPTDASSVGDSESLRPAQHLEDVPEGVQIRPPLYQLGQSGPGRTLSTTSLESEALLDHRNQPSMRPRRDSRMGAGLFAPRPTGAATSNTSLPRENSHSSSHARYARPHVSSGGDSDDDDADDRTPLIPSTNQDRPVSQRRPRGYGGFGPSRSQSAQTVQQRKPSVSSSVSSRRRRAAKDLSSSDLKQDYDVNNPPSVPNSPRLGGQSGYGDVMVSAGDFPVSRSPEERRATIAKLQDSVIDIDGDAISDRLGNSAPPSPRQEPEGMQRRRSMGVTAEDDVCFPLDNISEMADDEYVHNGQSEYTSRRRRRRAWPDLRVFEEWSREEKEERLNEGVRAKKISEPVLVGGRLRPQKGSGAWQRSEEDAPYRFTYFNEEFPSTIHSQTISELVQPGQTFRDLFIPDPPELSDSESESDDDMTSVQDNMSTRGPLSRVAGSTAGTRQSSIIGDSRNDSKTSSGEATPSRSQPPPNKEKPKRYGPRPTFWLDVLSPTDAEMRVISKAFGIHALTAEDILMQEAREKVELFRNYYFINYRTFEQDVNSEDYLEPVDMYVVVFREGVISFHFSLTPHPANVRRRIRQLKDYLILSSDWISYAIIDDITDVFAPLIQSIENEVDDIDEDIMKLHSDSNEISGTKDKKNKDNEKGETETESGGDMLRRVGEGRKKVMGLYRLLGNKADVIKGFAKRCNEQWEIAPKSEIGLYLGDIQDHILTMTSNLGHYET